MVSSIAKDAPEPTQRGPHPSYIQTAAPYVLELKINECLVSAGVTEAKDDSVRLQAVAWIDNVRKALHLPVRTYNTAVVYFHKFRLVHPESSGFLDAAAAALFTACKIEDTLKKSRDILCAAQNLKLSAAEQLTPDDPMFENHAKIVIGLERLMLEASGFDFRNRHPQRLLLKLGRLYGVERETVGKTAYKMSLDIYKTYAPLKQTTATMAFACLELAGRIQEHNVTDFQSGRIYKRWKITRPEVMETLLDLLELYTHHRASTSVGHEHPVDKFISIRIELNEEASSEKYPRFTSSRRKKSSTNGASAANGIKGSKDKASKMINSPQDTTSPRDVKSPMGLTSINGTSVQGKPGIKEGTIRFMLDPERVRAEKDVVSQFFKVEEEEYMVEVEKDRRRA
ncbi:MAG: hypothetical protein LQ351_001669 [Letrouitia transgressa]|nr:MAG: hypothetical protein LQ351_001669 [Letrouitia transgressa]